MRTSFSIIANALCLVLWLGINGSATADHGREIRPKSWQQDATIHDIFFINNTHGWAVGDQGVILRTTNGGDDWFASEGAGLDLDGHRSFEQKLARMRPISQTHELYPLTCSLKSVFFINERRGWIAGNYEIPYLNTSRSVLLTTNDGGETWSQLKGSILPRINRIYFQSVLAGWSLGSSGHLFDSGVFTTSTAGSSWSVTDVDPPNNWIDGELVPGGFVVIDDQGILGRIDAGKFEPAVVFGSRPGQLRSVRMLNAETGWAVGTAGTILMTRDGGQTWKRPDDLDPRLEHFDFNSVAIGEKRVWITGNPGTFVFSFDARQGEEFKQFATGSKLPLSRIFFSSDRRGWASGANGAILRTDDYGKSWQSQRGAGQRVAMLVVTDDPEQIPLASLSYIANEKNQLAAVVLIGNHNTAKINKAAAAVQRVGVSAFLRLHCDDLTNEEYHLDQKQRLKELVRLIRTLQPNVLTCDTSNSTSSEFELACRSAIDMAADSEAFPDQQLVELPPWQVARFMVRQDSGQDVKFAGSRYLARSGKLLEDQVAISRAILGMSARMDETEAFRVETFTGTVSVKRNDVFYGLEQLGNTVPTRKDILRMGTLNSIATAPLKHQEIGKLIAKITDGEQVSVAEMQVTIRDFATGSEPRESGIWLMQLAESLVEAGHLELAAYTMEQLLIRNGHHAFAPAALMWLAQYYASDEVAAVVIAANPSTTSEKDDELPNNNPVPVVTRRDGGQEISWEKNEAGKLLNADEVASRLAATFDDPDEAAANLVESTLEWRAKKASGFLLRLKRADLDFAQSPEIQFIEAMMSAKIPGNVSQDNLLNRIRRTEDSGSIYALAAGREMQTRKADFESHVCVRAEERPRLDGGLEDKVWKRIVESDLAIIQQRADQEDGEDDSDSCMLAYDDEFLFLAFRCRRLKDANYATADQVRTRDANLQGKDRVQLVLDTDRELRSAFLLEIDYRGWAAESCFGAKGWNPNWYIATGGDSDYWTLECAIPLEEISVKKLVGSAAAIVIRRLDSSNKNLWAAEGQQTTSRGTGGMTAGFNVETRAFELLKFEAIENGTRTAAVSPNPVR